MCFMYILPILELSGVTRVEGVAGQVESLTKKATINFQSFFHLVGKKTCHFFRKLVICKIIAQ